MQPPQSDPRSENSEGPPLTLGMIQDAYRRQARRGMRAVRIAESCRRFKAILPARFVDATMRAVCREGTALHALHLLRQAALNQLTDSAMAAAGEALEELAKRQGSPEPEGGPSWN